MLSKLIQVVIISHMICIAMAFAHQGDPKLRDKEPPYVGPGYRSSGRQAQSNPPEFESHGVKLLSWLTLGDFGANRGMDCWGYVSPSGRRYAIIGLSNGTAFVEITDPGNPQIIDKISGAGSNWRDVKVYDHYAYSVNETNNGIQVIDMSQIDDGIVTRVQDVIAGGNAKTHNVAINEESGYLYRCGGGFVLADLGLRAYDLSDPANPIHVGSWSERYVHDAVVVNWTTGKYAGREIAFCFGGFNSGNVDPGVDIVDVTDKENMQLISRYIYPAGSYSHQGWLNEDRTLIYLNDEEDEDEGLVATTTTHVINIEDLDQPFEQATFTNGNTAVDHNLYVYDGLIYEANYRSGLRIFETSDPLAPTEVAFFDTYPANDGQSYNGLWNAYPFFGDDLIVGSDIERGLFIWKLDLDCNDNGILDPYDIEDGTSTDCDLDAIPDECQADCNENGTPDPCDISTGTSIDCPGAPNGIPDECEVDCDDDGEPNTCALALGADDCDEDSIPDICQIVNDCNNNEIDDSCEVDQGLTQDVNENDIPDECEDNRVWHVSNDCDATGDGSLTSPFCSIGEAVAASVSGDAIVVADGVYEESDIDTTGRSITITSANGAHKTTVNLSAVGGTAFVAEGEAGQYLNISGFTIVGATGSAIRVSQVSAAIERCRFLDNASGLGGGGGLWLNGADVSVRNCLFANNSGNQGGAIYTAAGTTLIDHSTFYGNTSTAVGAAIYSTALLAMTNSIVWNHEIGFLGSISIFGGSASFEYNDIEGGESAVSSISAPVIYSDSNINSDPMFVDPDGLDLEPMNDFDLDSGSPVIDAGNPLFVDAGLSGDVMNHPRVLGNSTDMGCDESTQGALITSVVTPNLVETLNSITISGATPGETIFVLIGTKNTALALPGCSGVMLGVSDLVVVALPPTGTDGNARYESYVTSGQSGQIAYVQATEYINCAVTNVVTFVWP